MTADFDREQIDYGIELRGVYDGVAIWVLKDGRRVNRFAGEGTTRERRIQEAIDSMDTK